MHLKPKHAFTLIEIAVVLVIVGLLAAGILVGRDLIRAAQIRQQISQIERFDQAAGAFRNKYDCIAGDCADAEEIGLGTSAEPGANGNGNGLVDVTDFMTINRQVGMGESANFWYHLQKAGMISGEYPGNVPLVPGVIGAVPGLTTPELVLLAESDWVLAMGDSRGFGKRGGIAIVPLGPLSLSAPGWGNFTDTFNNPSANAWFLTMTLAALTTDNRIGVYYPNTLYALDIKMDDGKPFTGRMRAIPNTILFWNHSFYSNQPPFCFTTPRGTESQYNLSLTTATSTQGNAICSPLILTNF